MQAGYISYNPAWFTSKLPYNCNLVLFFYPGEMEPKISPTSLLHILIPLFSIALVFTATMIVLRKQLCQKLFLEKVSFIHGNQTNEMSAAWGSALPHWAIASQFHSKSAQVLWITLGLSWWFFSLEENGCSLQWAKILTLNILKGMLCACGWSSLSGSLNRDVSLAGWDWCYFVNADHCGCWQCRVHWWQNARILSNDSFSFHFSFPYSGYLLG